MNRDRLEATEVKVERNLTLLLGKNGRLHAAKLAAFLNISNVDAYIVKAHNEMQLDKLASNPDFWDELDDKEKETWPLSYARMAEIYSKVWKPKVLTVPGP